jgi:VWFA-related protein
MIDSSGSQRNVIEMEKEVGGAFLKQILTDKDEAYVISFDITVDLLQDFTRDIHRLQTALNKAKVNVDYTSGIPGMGGGPVPQQNAPGTLLYDAVYLSAHDMLSKEVGRKAMILLTDGQDEGRRHRSRTKSRLNRLRSPLRRPGILWKFRDGIFRRGRHAQADRTNRRPRH